MKAIPELKTENMIISILLPEYLELLAEYQRINRDHLAKWEPSRANDYLSLNETKQRIESSFESYLLGESISLVGFTQDKSRIIGLCTFSNIIHGVFQACNLGYSVCKSEQGKGLMFELLKISIQYVFDEYKLHRIMANYMPSNIRSEKLLIRLGFEKEGLAKSYLKIAGSWQDHVLTSKISNQ